MKIITLLIALFSLGVFAQELNQFLNKFNTEELSFTSSKTKYNLEFFESEQDFKDAGLTDLTEDEIQAFVNPYFDNMYTQYYASSKFNLPLGLIGIVVYKNVVNINSGSETKYYDLIILNSKGEIRGEITLTSWWFDDSSSGAIYSTVSFDGMNIFVKQYKSFNSGDVDQEEKTFVYDASGEFIEQ